MGSETLHCGKIYGSVRETFHLDGCSKSLPLVLRRNRRSRGVRRREYHTEVRLVYDRCSSFVVSEQNSTH